MEPEAWLYESYNENGTLKERCIWTFLPSDLHLSAKSHKYVKFIVTPLYRDKIKAQTFTNDERYDSRKLIDAFGGL